MTLNKTNISNVLYGLAVLFSYGNLAAMIIIQWDFIISGKGIGSFSTLWFIGYFAVSFIVWFVALLISKNRKWNIAYWVSIALPLAMFFLLPMSFYID